MNIETLTEAGYKDPEAVFAAAALAGGFGAVPPNHGGGLDIDGITDPAIKKAVADVLASAAKHGQPEKKEAPKA